jgi:hypothetical protein
MSDANCLSILKIATYDGPKEISSGITGLLVESHGNT